MQMPAISQGTLTSLPPPKLLLLPPHDGTTTASGTIAHCSAVYVSGTHWPDIEQLTFAGGSGSSEEQENVISIARTMVNMIKRLAVFFELLLIKAS
jgi:hypothetical protein